MSPLSWEHGRRSALALLVAGLAGGCSLLAPSDEELLGRQRLTDAGSGATTGGSQGGAPTGGTGGKGTGGGKGGAGGTSATGGSGGTTPDASPGDGGDDDGGPPPVPGTLARLRLELHCGERTSSTSDSCFLKLPNTISACPAEGYRPEVRATMQGEPGVTYSVTLHVRGVVEPKTYRNGLPVAGTGALDNKGLFYAGGEPGGNPIYNSYGLDVSRPAQRYFVNNWVEGNYVLALDYRVAIEIVTGATVSLYGFTQRCQISYDCADLSNVVNCPYKPLAGVEHLPDHGQFIQVDFVSAKPIPGAQTTEAP